MIWTERFFFDRQRALVERRGIRIVILISIKPRQIIQRCRDIKMIRAERLFSDRQRAFEERLGLSIASLTGELTCLLI